MRAWSRSLRDHGRTPMRSDDATRHGRDDLAPPLPERDWRRPLRHRITVVVAAVVVSPIVIWVCVEFGDWRSPSEGGWGKLFVGIVLAAVVLPACIVVETRRWWPQLQVARRGEPGLWMDAIAFTEDREEPTGNLIIRRSHVVRHWWLALHSLRDGDLGAVLLAVEVDERIAVRCRAGHVIQVYGSLAGDEPVVLALDGAVVWPTTQRPRIPAGAVLL